MSERRRILGASALALAAAGALLVTLVLPAEYGWDPLGTGEALGLTGLADSRVSPLSRQPARWRSDRIEFELAPFEAVEYKYRLEAGDTLLFSWSSESEVLYDLHAEPDGAAPGYADSFAKSRGSTDAGSYTAPFSGIHGWFWQNRGQAPVTVRLETEGYYTEAVEMRDGCEFRYGP